MTRNMGTADRVLRAIVGAGFILAFFLGWVSGWLGWLLLAIGVIFLLTTLMGNCPLYRPFGIKTGGD